MHLMHLPVPAAEHTAQSVSTHAVHLKSPGFVADSWNVVSGHSAEQIVCVGKVLAVSSKAFSQRVQVAASEHSRQFDEQAMPAAVVAKGTVLTQIWPVGVAVEGVAVNAELQEVQAKLDVQESQPKTHLSQVLVTVLAK